MLYNIEEKKLQTPVDCMTCPHFDTEKKKCTGIGKCCFEYDAITKTIIDPVTKLTLKLK